MPRVARLRLRRLPSAARPAAELLAELRTALSRSPPEIPCRFFYDDAGAALFERITTLPEYYLTRAEAALLSACAPTLVRLTRAEEVLELGAGSARKTRVLLDALAQAGTLRRYLPLDLEETQLRHTGAALLRAYPDLEVELLVGDFTRDLEALPPGAPRLYLFLGSTLGNLRDQEAAAFLGRLAKRMGPGDHLLLGLDLVKDPRRLEAAYNDSAGVTAAFNRNILRVVNRLAGADFNPQAFNHRAFYRPEKRRIEMWLLPAEPQTVHFRRLDLSCSFTPTRGIRTEISTKYTRSVAETLLSAAGLCLREWVADEAGAFGLALAARRS